MTDSNRRPEVVSLAAVLADDDLVDAVALGAYVDDEPRDPAIAGLVGSKRTIDSEPLNPRHTAALEHALGRPLGDGPFTGGAR